MYQSISSSIYTCTPTHTHNLKEQPSKCCVFAQTFSEHRHKGQSQPKTKKKNTKLVSTKNAFRVVLLSWQWDTTEGWEMSSAIWLSFALWQLHFAATGARPASHHPTTSARHAQGLSVKHRLHLALYITGLSQAPYVLNHNHICSESVCPGASQVTLWAKKSTIQAGTRGRPHCMTFSHLCCIPLLAILPIPPLLRAPYLPHISDRI